MKTYIGTDRCTRCGGGSNACSVCNPTERIPYRAILARRIERLQLEFSRAKTEGRDTAPFHRRSRSLSTAYLAVMDEMP